jgi:hypothetical protein
MNSILTANASINSTVRNSARVMTIAASVMTFALTIAVAFSASAQTPNKYPGKRVAGATRSVCEPPILGAEPALNQANTNQANPNQANQPIFKMTALVPRQDVLSSTKTTSENPIVWVYMPYAKSQGHSSKLDLRVTDPNGNSVTNTISLPENPGIMPISLPATLKFEVGKSYGWALHLNCGGELSSGINLTIDRVADQVKSTTGNAVGKFQPYDRNGIWLNAIAEVIKLNGKNPTLSPEAQRFLIEQLAGDDLQAVGLDPRYLEKLAQQPIVPIVPIVPNH